MCRRPCSVIGLTLAAAMRRIHGRRGARFLEHQRIAMSDERLSVLFLCTGDSARSQMAEALLRQLSRNRIDVYSAGSAPQPEVHPMAREILEAKYRIDTSDLHPKSLNVFLGSSVGPTVTLRGNPYRLS